LIFEYFSKIFFRKFKVHYNRTRITGILNEKQRDTGRRRRIRERKDLEWKGQEMY